MIKTTVDLDENLLNRAIEMFKGKSRKEIISLALNELVKQHEQKDLYDLFESPEQLLADGYDYKAMRGGGFSDIG